MANLVPPGVAGLVGLFKSGETWENRLREAAYTPPSGTRITFKYEAVARETTLRTAAFEFAGVNEAYVQGNGFGSRRYPMICFFSGPQHDLIATALENALLEGPVGKLEHPLYGTFNVTPFGDITRRDDLVGEANQTVIEVTFWSTLKTVYPSDATDPQNEIAAALAGFDVAAAQQFADSTDLLTTISQTNLKSTIRKFLRDIEQTLEKVSDSVEDVNREFRDITSLINLGLDTLVGDPLQLAQQVSNLIKAPGRAVIGIDDRLQAYADLAAKIFGEAAARPADMLIGGVSLALRNNRVANDFHASDLVVANAVTGSIVSVLNTQFATKPQAIAAAASLAEQFDAAVAWRDGGFAALGGIKQVGSYQTDTGETYQALQQTAARTIALLIQTSFSLVPERAVVLDRNRTIIDLCAELYGTVDDKLDFMIETNELSGSEILELPRGRKIKWYDAA